MDYPTEVRRIMQEYRKHLEDAQLQQQANKSKLDLFAMSREEEVAVIHLLGEQEIKISLYQQVVDRLQPLLLEMEKDRARTSGLLCG